MKHITKRSDFLIIQHRLIDHISKKHNYLVRFIDEVNSPSIEENDQSIFQKDIYGAYDPYLELAIVYTNSVPDLTTLVLTCFHEYRHAVQHQKLLSNEEFYFWTKLVSEKHRIDGAFYKANPLEIDAKVFAATLGKTSALSEILCRFSIQEAQKNLDKGNKDDLLIKMIDAAGIYAQISETVPALDDVHTLVDALFPQKISEQKVLDENAPKTLLSSCKKLFRRLFSK